MKKKEKGIFWKIYGIVVILSLIVIAGVWVLLWNFLSAYEKSQPEHVADKVVAELNDKKADAISCYLSEEVSELQDKTLYEEYISNFLSEFLDGEWSYAKKSGEYSKESPVYKLKKDGKSMAVLYLKMEEDRAAFNTPRWSVDRIEGIETKGRTITIEVPKGSEVTFNNTLLSAEYVTEDDVENSRLGNVSNFITAPKMTIYSVKGIYTEPQISVKGPVYGEPLSVDDMEDDKYVYGFESGSTEVANQESRIITISKTYGNYVTNDLKFSSLSPYILPDSYAYDFLWGVSSTNYWFTEHTSTDFENMKVYNYQVYTDDCFSCEVTFDQIVMRGSKKYTFPTHIKYIFVKKDGQWYVADISLKSTEE
ncbi:MAG: hypothetical protein ACI4D4_10155 [Lachnospira sp.]